MAFLGTGSNIQDHVQNLYSTTTEDAPTVNLAALYFGEIHGRVNRGRIEMNEPHKVAPTPTIPTGHWG
jgi:hypothetical protein